MDDPANLPDDAQSATDDNSVDSAAKVEYDKSKRDGKLFSAREKSRVEQEAAAGESTWSKWPKQNGGGLDGSA